MAASATNCATYKVTPILNTSAPAGTFTANKYLVPFQIYTFNNQGVANLPAINGSNGGSPVPQSQDSLIGGSSIFTLAASSTPGDYSYTLNPSDSRWSWISSMTVQWIANDVTTNPGKEEWRIIINAQSNYNSGSTRGVTILFRFGNGTEYGTVFPLYVAQNENSGNPPIAPSSNIPCNPSW